MRKQLEEAALDCMTVTFSGALSRSAQITRIALEVAKDFRRRVTITPAGADVIVTFKLAATGER